MAFQFPADRLEKRAARGLLIDVNEQAWQRVSAGETLDAAMQVELRGVVAYAMNVAMDIALQAFRHGGGTALPCISTTCCSAACAIFK